MKAAMKAVILAGGVGSRLGEETVIRPKPMVEIGGKPILWHIMKIDSAAGIDDFVICLGYRGYMIKEYFASYSLHVSDVSFDLARNEIQVHQNSAEPWRVTLIDTGDETQTGARLKRALSCMDGNDFCFTYGDGVSNVDIRALVGFNHAQRALATVTAIQPSGRYGALELRGERVSGFQEKPHHDEGWINGGLFVLSPQVGEYTNGDATVWERKPVERLAREGELASYKHEGFWYAMDTLCDMNELEALWRSGRAPWKTWP